jgi:VWFA-related protein
MPRFLFLSLLCGLLAAQQQQAPTPPSQDQQPPTTFRAGTEEVVAPVLVFDRAGGYVNGLRPDQFRLFDNSKEQNIHVDVTFTPISLVVAIQANSHVDKILPQVRRVGNLITPAIIGEQGEAALIAYDSRVRVLQDFTNDPEKITEKIKSLYAGSTSNRMIDAVAEGARMLRSRPQNRRRILLLIGETRDLASESNARQTLIDLQMYNVVLYSVDMSRLISTFSAGPQPGRPDPLPPAMRPLPPGVPATPTTVQQTYGTNTGRAEFIPLMVEIFKDVKAIFKANPVELFTKGTGGTEFSFYRQRGLEEAMQAIGEQLHSQYLVAYNPSNKEEGGFHEISIEVIGHPEYRTQTRPGYWLATKN